MRRMVVDSNYMQSDELSGYLARSASNFAVLNDYSHMEAFKGNTLKSAFNSYRILSRYPKQVLVLKPMARLAALRGRKSGLQRRMIDDAQTANFGNWCQTLARAEQGDPKLQAAMQAWGRDADAHLATMQQEMDTFFTRGLAQEAGIFSANELRILRKQEQFTQAMVDKLLERIFKLALFHFAHHDKIHKLPPQEEWHNLYILRGAICEYLLVLHWLAKGGADGVKPERLRNDAVDLQFVTCATFFDGLLSADAKALDLYENAKYVVAEFDRHVDEQIRNGFGPDRIYGTSAPSGDPASAG